tara:strand:- start:51 stop:236 length:186 start_codon:yes stop_codon:yes gene_type:complete
MPDVKTFYPGATAGNTINNSTVTATVDDQNAVPNSKVWTGTAAEYTAVSPKDADTLYFVTA